MRAYRPLARYDLKIRVCMVGGQQLEIVNIIASTINTRTKWFSFIGLLSIPSLLGVDHDNVSVCVVSGLHASSMFIKNYYYYEHGS